MTVGDIFDQDPVSQLRLLFKVETPETLIVEGRAGTVLMPDPGGGRLVRRLLVARGSRTSGIGWAAPPLAAPSTYLAAGCR